MEAKRPNWNPLMDTRLTKNTLDVYKLEVDATVNLGETFESMFFRPRDAKNLLNEIDRLRQIILRGDIQELATEKYLLQGEVP